jgi:hypothetical protein
VVERNVLRSEALDLWSALRAQMPDGDQTRLCWVTLYLGNSRRAVALGGADVSISSIACAPLADVASLLPRDTGITACLTDRAHLAAGKGGSARARLAAGSDGPK